MKTKVYSWRISEELKSRLERHARLHRVPISTLLETAVGGWLAEVESEADGEDVQRRLHQEAAKYIGVLDGGDPHRAENARNLVRQRLRSRRAG